MKKCSAVKKHLKRDSKTWEKMSKRAKEESEDDKELIKKLKTKKRK